MKDDPLKRLADFRRGRGLRRNSLPTSTDGRLVIRIEPGELERIVDEAEDSLLAGESGLYQRGHKITRVGRMKIPTRDGFVFLPAIVEVKRPHLLERLSTTARFENWSSRAEDWVIINCHRDVADAYLDRKGKWRLSYLAGIVTAPTIRPDGSVLQKPGYDEQTGLYLDTCGVEFPTIPSRPTREEAIAALEVLGEPIRDFPFVSAVDRSVALSAMITAAVRAGMPVAPMHAFTAPTAGTGKSMLVDIASIIATGEEAAVISTGRDGKGSAAELEKRLTALMLAGAVVISIDNVEESLGSELLCQMLTQRRLSLRPLRTSENVEVPNTAVVFATGNNLTFLGDMTRRVLVGRMDARCERPELREFSFDPITHARQNRARLVTAALTMVLARLAADEGPSAPALGNYREWSRFVREPLLWLGADDPVKVMEETRRDDPRLAKLKKLVQAWRSTFPGNDPLTVNEIIRKGQEQMPNPGPEDEAFGHPELRNALLAITSGGEHKPINPEKLSWFLRKNADKFVDGWSVVRDDTDDRQPRWKLAAAAG